MTENEEPRGVPPWPWLLAFATVAVTLVWLHGG